jgi:hypothetical protein
MRCDRIFLRRELYFLKAKAADAQAIFQRRQYSGNR